MTARQRAVLLAPFWQQAHHVGVYRVERFARWLGSAGVDVVVVKAGDRDAVRDEDLATVVTVKDPFYSVAAPQLRTSSIGMRIAPFRNVIVNAISPPDGKMAWARRVARHPIVRDYARGARWIISSSPPESAHLAGSALAGALCVPHVVDMRDGWLDEPLKWLLRHSWLQRFREARLERLVIQGASHVFVVSDVLREMLVARVPEAESKTSVLMNSGPATTIGSFARTQQPRTRPRLLYAGRLGASNARQSARLLLDALSHGYKTSPAICADLHFLGSFHPREHRIFASFGGSFERVGWSIGVSAQVERDQAVRAMHDAEGLLLLALGRGILTTKLFDYLSTGKPILAVTVRDGALWRLAGNLPQLFLVDAAQLEGAAAPVAGFLAAASQGASWPAPSWLSDDAMRDTFLTKIGHLPVAQRSASISLGDTAVTE